VNPRELIENSLLMIREKAIKHGIRVAAETRDLPGTIRADERKLKQIMYNLLSNAMKFTPDGGEIRVTANIVQEFRTPESERSWEKTATHNPHREHPGHLQPSGIRVCVADTGIGIEPDNLERIFKPFEQVESSTSRKYQGTGLGLSLTRSLVELHGGRIWADSGGEGKGSTFCFQIPLRP
jgi:signal transduction histidine kinase